MARELVRNPDDAMKGPFVYTLDQEVDPSDFRYETELTQAIVKQGDDEISDLAKSLKARRP